MEKSADRHEQKPKTFQSALARFPLLLELKKNCDECAYQNQDIDCYPCDRCHTRH
jgi:hypothetical protein